MSCTKGWGNCFCFENVEPPQSCTPCGWIDARYVPWGDHCTNSWVQCGRSTTFSGSSFFMFQNTPTLSPRNKVNWSRAFGSPSHQRKCSFSLKGSMCGGLYSSSMRPSRPYRSISVSLFTARVCFLSSAVPWRCFTADIACSGVSYSTKANLENDNWILDDAMSGNPPIYIDSYPSDIPLSSTGMKTASALVRPTVFNFRTKYFTSLSLLSSGTTGRPSRTTKASRPSSKRTSYCAFKSRVYCQ